MIRHHAFYYFVLVGTKNHTVHTKFGARVTAEGREKKRRRIDTTLQCNKPNYASTLNLQFKMHSNRIHGDFCQLYILGRVIFLFLKIPSLI